MKNWLEILLVFFVIGCADIVGPKGDRGDVGATGSQGSVGPAGANGADGSDGVDYTLTEEDLLAGQEYKTKCEDGLTEKLLFSLEGKLVHQYILALGGCNQPKVIRIDRVAEFAIASTSMAVAYQSVYATILKQEFVDDLNSSETCGFTDWELNIPKDLTGNDCLDSQFQPESKVYTYENIANTAIKLDGTKTFTRK